MPGSIAKCRTSVAGLGFAGCDRAGPTRIDDDDTSRRIGLARDLLTFLVLGDPAQIWNPVIEKIVGLGLVGVGADREDGVGKLGVFVAVVELANAHVTRGMHLGIVGWTVVDADVLDLHGLEVELAGAPRILVAAAGATVVEGRDEEVVLTPRLLEHGNRHTRDEVKRVVP